MGQRLWGRPVSAPHAGKCGEQTPSRQRGGAGGNSACLLPACGTVRLTARLRPSREATTPTGLGTKGLAVYPGFRNPGLYAATPLGLTSSDVGGMRSLATSSGLANTPESARISRLNRHHWDPLRFGAWNLFVSCRLVSCILFLGTSPHFSSLVVARRRKRRPGKACDRDHSWRATAVVL